MWKHLVTYGLIVAVCCGIPRAAVAVVPTDGLGAVELSLKPCAHALSSPFKNGTLTYQIWGDNANIEKRFPWNSRDSKPLHLAMQLPPGVYTYDVVGSSVAEKQPGCQAFFYFAVLPGDTRHIDVEMLDCCGDPIPRLYVAGVAPAGINVSVARFETAPSCGAPVTGLTSIPIDLERTAVGYYASDNHLSGEANARGAVFGLIVARTSGETRTIRVTADYPTEFLGAFPKLVRFDLTAAVLSAAFADTLYCST
jgi:hypothetical protein